jgi:hypothetical protein
LNEAHVRFIIVGGFAVNAHGYTRFTNDVDIVVSLETDNILKSLAVLFLLGYRPLVPVTPEDFANPETRRMWQVEKAMTVLQLWSDVHQRTPIDLFIFEPFDFSAEYSRIKQLEIGHGIVAPILDRESLISMKRAVGRPLDLIDVAALEDLKRIEETPPHG